MAITASKSVQFSDLDLGDHLVAADQIGAGFGSLALLFVAGGDHQHLLRFAQTVGQHDGAADHLVGVLGIDSQAHVQLHGFVELGEFDFLNQRHGLLDRIRTALYLTGRGGVLLAWCAAHNVIGPNGPDELAFRSLPREYEHQINRPARGLQARPTGGILQVMAATTNLMSWEAFEQLPDGDGYHRELIEGELQILPPPKSGHSRIAHRLHRAMIPAEAAADGQAFIEAGFKLSTDPATWVQPEVSFLRNDRLLTVQYDDYFLGAPEFAVEVVSPSESAADLERKVELMLGAGSLAVWVVYPRQRKVHVYRPDGSLQRRVAGETLLIPELLPGWELPVARLFED